MSEMKLNGKTVSIEDVKRLYEIQTNPYNPRVIRIVFASGYMLFIEYVSDKNEEEILIFADKMNIGYIHGRVW